MSKPKILITGFNKQQCTRDYFRFNSQLKIVPSHYSLAMCLEDMGYDVEQRQVTIGESLDSYDEVIVFLHNPGGFAEFVYNGLWAIYNRPSCIMAFDDYTWEHPSKDKYLCPKAAINLFVTIKRRELDLVAVNDQFWIRKK